MQRSKEKIKADLQKKFDSKEILIGEEVVEKEFTKWKYTNGRFEFQKVIKASGRKVSSLLSNHTLREEIFAGRKFRFWLNSRK